MRKLFIVAVIVSTGFIPTSSGALFKNGYVGYIGCSQAIGAVDGYHMVGGTRMWPAISAYGGGTVQAWAERIPAGEQWNAFKYYLQALPPSQIWVQWCRKAGDNPALDYPAAVKVLREVHRLAPGIPVYVSAQNGYVLPHACPKSGLDGPPLMEILALATLGEGLTLRGPDVGDLRSKYQTKSILPGDQTQSDGCHPNDAGRTQVLGPALLRFFK